MQKYNSDNEDNGRSLWSLLIILFNLTSSVSSVIVAYTNFTSTNSFPPALRTILTGNEMIRTNPMMFLQFKLWCVLACCFNPFSASLCPQILCLLIKLFWHSWYWEEPASIAVIWSASTALHNTSLHHFIAVHLHMRNNINSITFINS